MSICLALIQAVPDHSPPQFLDLFTAPFIPSRVLIAVGFIILLLLVHHRLGADWWRRKDR